jgi:hypothetical protein
MTSNEKHTVSIKSQYEPFGVVGGKNFRGNMNVPKFDYSNKIEAINNMWRLNLPKV